MEGRVLEAVCDSPSFNAGPSASLGMTTRGEEKVRPLWIFLIAFSFITSSTLGAQKQRAQPSADQPLSFSLSIRAPRSTIELSSDAIVHVTITNTSDHDLFAPDLAFDLRDSAGQPVPRVQRKPGVPPGGSFVSTPLKPGQSIDSSINLKNDFVITAPGKYTVQAWREDYVAGTNKVRGRVKSNTITIDIVE